MKNAYQKHHAHQISKIIDALPASTDTMRRAFVRGFYAKVPASDLEKFQPKRAIALAESAFEFMRERAPGKPKIRIFTPTKRTHGYDSDDTIIEMINDDMPFLIDSLLAELSRHGVAVRENIHPVFRVLRSRDGVLRSVETETGGDESFIHVEIPALPESLLPAQLEKDLEWVLEHIRLSVVDWKPIVARAEESIRMVGSMTGRFDAPDIREVQDFLRWLITRNFIFLGYSEYDFFDDKGKETFRAIPDAQLGILKLTDDIAPRGLASVSPELRRALLTPQLIEITKSSRRSPVHRAVPMDYIGLKRFDAKGKVIGEKRFLGLFTSTVYYQSTENIPLARRKVALVMERAGFDPSSHDGKALKTILEFLPRDELLQMPDDELFETGMGILALEAKPGVRLFVRKDLFERFVSCMVFVPREQFSTDLRQQIQLIVEKAYNGVTSAFSTQITEAPLARLHLIIKTSPGDIPSVDIQAVEQEIAKRAYLWRDLLLGKLVAKFGDKKAHLLHRTYGQAFPQSYINRHDTTPAVYDIEKIEEAYRHKSLTIDLYRDRSDTPGRLRLKIYNPNEEIALSDILPIMENAGFRVIEEQPFLVTPEGRDHSVWIRDFQLESPIEVPALEKAKPLLEETLLKVWRGEMENDAFNALTLRASLSSKHITMLRAYGRYLKQTGFAAGGSAIAATLAQHPMITNEIVALFQVRFGPNEKHRDEKQLALQQSIDAKLADVKSAAEDRILRRYVDVMLATLRTNYFCDKPVLSFKFDSGQVPELPLPRPYAEIFVYSPRVEGIHLRGGKVARGGLRWSDRHEDFRTEVLGLMKAQMVKNSVIVPVGSKGGFVVKRPPAAREAYLEEGIACYKLYLSGLLDLTDNIVKSKVIPPKDVVRHDGDDPYLVVAADKGTATFSDIANGVSKEYGFWLGDAFASGGSAGYDHKKMAITARGGWISVTRHFQEMGVDIAKESFTCVGVGDMAGDVFGNGMLLSKTMRLLAAFNHLHIFIDPSPDPAKSFAERQRLFDLPRSSWKDYDASLISKGGGVFERSAKSIDLSKEAQTALGVSKSKLTPDEVIRAILTAPVDLLWNGGIGTYVKAEDETHDQVGDRANNAVRVNGKELRCKLVGEGGNLGFTQKGRIEYARAGGRINTDAIDNSAGVDCSDHEVNIKIAFSGELASGKLTLAKRDKLLASMTDEVARLVLKDNILQTQAITIAEQRGAEALEAQSRLIRLLEGRGILNREIEFLPSDKQLLELKATGRGLTRPEIAVLLAYSKMALYTDMLASSLPDEAYFVSDLKRYFPILMQKDFARAIETHPLRREIIATVMTNSIVNRAGMTFCFDIAEDLGASVRDIAAAYATARDAFGLRQIWNGIEAHAAVIDVATQSEIYAMTTQFLERVSTWLLHHLPMPLDVDTISREIIPEVAEIEKHVALLHSEQTRAEAIRVAERLRAHAVPAALAESVASLGLLSAAPDIISVAHKHEMKVKEVGKIYFELGSMLGLSWLRSCAERLPMGSHWDKLAIKAIIADLYDEQRRLTDRVIAGTGGLPAWLTTNQADIASLERFMEGVRTGEAPDLPRLMVTLRQIRALGAL